MKSLPFQESSVLLVNPVLEPDGAQRPIRHAPLFSLYLAAGLQKVGVRVGVADLYHRGRGWQRALDEALAGLAGYGGRCAVVLVRHDYDRPLPVATVTHCGEVASRHPRAGTLLLAGVAGEGEAEALLQAVPQAQAALFAWGEVTLARLWSDGDRRGVWVRGEQPVPLGPAPDVDSLPFPAWDLVQPATYWNGAPHRFRFRPYLPVLAMRGCPYRCSFCDKSVFGAGNRVWMRQPESVLAEIGWLRRRYGVREIQFAEPVFVLDGDWVSRMCAGLRALPFRLTWSCHVRADLLTREIMQELARSGCWNVLMGVESASPAVLEAIGKGLDLAHVERVVRWGRELGVQTTASYVLGLPGDTPQTISQTIAYASRLDSDYAQFFLHKAYGGRPQQPGDRVEEAWDLSAHDIPGPRYLPSAFGDFAELEILKRQAYRRFYLRPACLSRQLAGAFRPGQLRRLTQGGTALLRILRS